MAKTPHRRATQSRIRAKANNRRGDKKSERKNKALVHCSDRWLLRLLVVCCQIPMPGGQDRCMNGGVALEHVLMQHIAGATLDCARREPRNAVWFNTARLVLG